MVHENENFRDRTTYLYECPEAGTTVRFQATDWNRISGGVPPAAVMVREAK